jgi:hypothetical protein
MVTAAIAQLELGTLAQILFACPLQPSQRPSPEMIRSAIAVQFRSCHGDPAACLAVVAQEAGDRPDLYADRMQWALGCAAGAYSARPAGNQTAVRASSGGGCSRKSAALAASS